MMLGYLGPGAGLAAAGGLLTLITGMLAGLAALAAWPIRRLFRRQRRRTRRGRTGIGRVVILGLDGLDPGRVRALMERGELPALRRLAAEGHGGELGTTNPPLSPVAWTSFQTGVNPGKHNIFDFVRRDAGRYGVEPAGVTWRSVGKGPAVPAGERRSVPFWTTLGEAGIFSVVLRVPGTFPPEPFWGNSVSGLFTPDLRGTMGSFTLCTEFWQDARRMEGGEVSRLVEGLDGWLEAEIRGPADLPTARLKAKRTEGGRVMLELGKVRLELREGEWTDWLEVGFGNGRRGTAGICRVLLLASEPRLRIYVSAVHVNPARPFTAVASPGYFGNYLANRHGLFGTLGMGEETWGLVEGVLGDEEYLAHAYGLQAERERLLFDGLARTKSGLCAAVFDLTDRVQHVFHGRGEAVAESYRRADKLVGQVWEAAGTGSLVLVVSDHGFTDFHRGFQVNRWLMEAGLLKVKRGCEGQRWLEGVDWEQTQAYGLGMNGLYVNMRGREGCGQVAQEEAPRLAERLAAELERVIDPATGRRVVSKARLGRDIFTGPYAENGPDVVLGYARGYRAAWEAVGGGLTGEVLADNTRLWRGDHGVDGAHVPGVLFSNRQLDVGEDGANIMDVAPTVLEAFGVTPGGHLDGKGWKVG